LSADGRGLVSQAGAVLLWETMRVTGLARGLSARLARWRAPRAVHDPGKVIADLAAAVAFATAWPTSRCCARPELTGPVASDPVVSLVAGSREETEALLDVTSPAVCSCQPPLPAASSLSATRP
jgi:hypothetical protein